jgi:hypothetical protein
VVPLSRTLVLSVVMVGEWEGGKEEKRGGREER